MTLKLFCVLTLLRLVIASNETCDFSDKCGKKPRLFKFNSTEALDALSTRHLFLRRKLATGVYSPHGFYQGSDIFKVRGQPPSTETECAAKLCSIREPVPGMNVDIFEYPKDNLSTDDIILQHTMDRWVDNARDCPKKLFLNYTNVSHKCSLFTQMMWGSAQNVSCSGVKFGKKFIVACQYKPPGNILGAPMYTQGIAGSDCGKFQTDFHLTVLCDAQRPSISSIIRISRVFVFIVFVLALKGLYIFE